MKNKLLTLLIFLCLSATAPVKTMAQSPPNIPKPTPQQYAWQEQERIMFISFDPATWEGREYDNLSLPLSRLNPQKLNTDQWCRVAQSWGAKEILLVAKHAGGFCWWQTPTTNYSIGHTPWRKGRGDVLADLEASCKKFGLNLGVYLSPTDASQGAGGGGKTKDTTKQAAYDRMYREQLTELLTRYGKITEVWFDGSCVIPVSDILHAYAKNAVIFQGPDASIRWPGTESGILTYPAWNTLKQSDLKTGVATEAQGDPDGDAWAPLEADAPLYNHYWFWSPEKERKTKTLQDLMNIYDKSVGYGAVFLLNANPDTTGLIPETDVKLYAAFGREISREYDHPLATVQNIRGSRAEIDLHTPTLLNGAILREQYQYGARVRQYTLEGWAGNKWIPLSTGTAIGREKIDHFREVRVSKVRLVVNKSVSTPLLRSLALAQIKNVAPPTPQTTKVSWQKCGGWDEGNFKNSQASVRVDLSRYIPTPGQYEVRFVPAGNKGKLEISQATLYFDKGAEAPDFLRTIASHTFNINRTQQVTGESSTVLQVTLTTADSGDRKGRVYIRPGTGQSTPPGAP